MTTVVLLVLAVIWGALLISWLRSRSVSTFSDSVGTFRRHLNVLERTTPTSVRPANRLRDAARPLPVYRTGPVRGQRIDSLPGAPGRLGAPLSGPGARALPPGGPGRLPAYRSGAPASAAALRRRRVQKRRRDVFFTFLAGAVGSFLLALIPGLSVMWAVQVLFDIVLAVYVTLLVRMRNLAAERELKLRFMPGETRLVRRPQVTYDFAAGYGDLELRRAAN